MVQALFYQILKHTSSGCRHHILEYLGEMCPMPNFTEAQFLIRMMAKQCNVRSLKSLQSRMSTDPRTVESLLKTDVSLVKNSLSRMLYCEQDSISEKGVDES